MEAIICGIDIKARSNHDFFLISIHINNPEGQEEATWVGWGCSNFTWKKWKQNRIYLLDWSLNKNIGWFRNGLGLQNIFGSDPGNQKKNTIKKFTVSFESSYLKCFMVCEQASIFIYVKTFCKIRHYVFCLFLF